MNDYLTEWAKNNLNPENQQKFFEEQQRIKDNCERVEAWHYHTEAAMNLTPAQISFLREHNVILSTAYIGMVRVYKDNRTIFQTSAMASVFNGLLGGPLIDYESLTKQIHEYLNILMSATPEIQSQLLFNHVPLFHTCELDQIRAMCNKD